MSTPSLNHLNNSSVLVMHSLSLCTVAFSPPSSLILICFQKVRRDKGRDAFKRRLAAAVH